MACLWVVFVLWACDSKSAKLMGSIKNSIICQLGPFVRIMDDFRLVLLFCSVDKLGFVQSLEAAERKQTI